MTRRLSLLLAVVLAFGLVSLAAAQQQDQPKAAPNPLVQLLQTKGVLTSQEAAAINQAATPAEQQQRLTQLLYSKGIITQNEYQTTAAAEASVASDRAALLPASAHVSAGDPEPAMAMPPQAPAAPAVIPAVAPVRVLTNDPPKAGGLVPDIKLGSGAKIKLYGFVKATAAYDTSNPYNLDWVAPGLGGTANATSPTDVQTGLISPFSSTNAGVGTLDSGPNGSPSFYLKGTATRMGANFEWPDFAGSSNTLTGRIETDFEGNFSRATNRNVSSLRTRMLSIRLAYARIDHKYSESTTGFLLFGVDWTPFGSSAQPSLLETTGGMAFFGGLYEREAQIRAGIWHDFGGSRNFKIGIEPAIGMPGWGSVPADVGVQLGVSERQGSDSGVPEASGRVVFQWQLDKAKGVAPAQLIFSGMWARRREIVDRQAIVNAVCTGTAVGGATVGPGNGCAGGALASLLAQSNFLHGATVSSRRWGGNAQIQLPTRYATLVGSYYTGADMTWYFAGQLLRPFNDGRLASGLLFNGFDGSACGVNGGGCPQSFSMDASPPNVVFGYNNATGQWQAFPQHPIRATGGFAQLSFPLSRIFDANPAGRNAGWTIAFTYGTDQAKARDVRASTVVAGVNGTLLNANGTVVNSTGQRDRSDAGVATLMWKFNQYVTFGLESSVYLTRSTCAGTGENSTTFGCGNGTTNGTPFRATPARYWHDFRNEFGPIFTF